MTIETQTRSAASTTPEHPYVINRRAPVFIGGQRRSGTTLMRTMLGRHPNLVAVPHESFFFQDERFELFFQNLLDWHGKRFAKFGIGQPEMDRAVAAFVGHFFESYRQSSGAQRWVEKSTKNIKRIDYLFRIFPDAQFIHMIRDPRDALCSMKQRVLKDRPDWVQYTAQVTAPEWVRCITTGRKWRDRPDIYLEVRYEDAVREPEVTMRGVLDFLGEPWDSAVLEPSDHPELGKHFHEVFATSVGRWKKELSETEIACFHSVAGDLMKTVGYALNESK